MGVGRGGGRRLPLLMIAGLEKALYRHRNTREKLAACGEDGLAEITVLQTSRRVKEKREGADCRVSRGILHREERRGAERRTRAAPHPGGGNLNATGQMGMFCNNNTRNKNSSFHSAQMWTHEVGSGDLMGFF